MNQGRTSNSLLATGWPVGKFRSLPDPNQVALISRRESVNYSSYCEYLSPLHQQSCMPMILLLRKVGGIGSEARLLREPWVLHAFLGRKQWNGEAKKGRAESTPPRGPGCTTHGHLTAGSQLGLTYQGQEHDLTLPAESCGQVIPCVACPDRSVIPYYWLWGLDQFSQTGFCTLVLFSWSFRNVLPNLLSLLRSWGLPSLVVASGKGPGH